MNKTAQIENLPENSESTLMSSTPGSQWQRELSAAIRDPAELLRRLGISELDLSGRLQAHESFPVLVPESFLNRMQTGNPRDPLLLQVLSSSSELIDQEGFIEDAVDDQAARKAPGLLQKYHGRALMITLGQCAVHCRYCFRRHYPYQSAPRTLEQWQKPLQVLREDTSLDEAILSGGDPLVLSDRRLGELLSELEAIPHLKRVRVHTRLPIVLPSRVTEQLLSRFQNSRLQTIFVVHANHFAEIADDCADSLKHLTRAGIPTLNQAVLLKEINDTIEVQAELCQRLINLGVIPYYLHQLDRVRGAAHFETDQAVGLNLIEQLKSLLPGYAVPRFVREIAGESSKTEILPVLQNS